MPRSPFYELLNTTIYEPLDWYPVINFRKTPTQNDASYEEQLFVIKVCVESINPYLDVINTGFAKNIIIAVFPGSGKNCHGVHFNLFSLKTINCGYSSYDVPLINTTWWVSLA